MTSWWPKARAWWQVPSPLVRWTIVALVVVVVVVVGGYGWYSVTHCGTGIDNEDGQCVGISDGTHGPVFGTETAAALRVIGEENARLDATGKPWVSVAYAIPLPAPGTNDDLAVHLADDLMGAAVAQRQVNRTGAFGETPAIRLLVVNLGDRSHYWRKPVSTLIQMSGPQFATDKLMAVAMGGQSLVSIQDAISALAAAAVPVIPAQLTADKLTFVTPAADTSIARLIPTNSDQAKAAVAYLRPTTHRAMIVQDSNPADTYSQSLGAAFQATYPDVSHQILPLQEPYNGAQDGVANTMPGILLDICQQRPDVVFFAGRAPELGDFVKALPHRPCLDLQVRVVTGSDAVEFTLALARGETGLREGLAANASVTYTEIASPASWQATPAAFNAPSGAPLTGSCPDCFSTLFPRQSLNDGAAIVSYDAILLAVKGIRLGKGGPATNPGALVQEFKRMHGISSVPGASGWISLSPTGSANNKAVPILQIAEDGTITFQQLSSPIGQPCIPNTTPC